MMNRRAKRARLFTDLISTGAIFMNNYRKFLCMGELTYLSNRGNMNNVKQEEDNSMCNIRVKIVSSVRRVNVPLLSTITLDVKTYAFNITTRSNLGL